MLERPRSFRLSWRSWFWWQLGSLPLVVGLLAVECVGDPSIGGDGPGGDGPGGHRPVAVAPPEGGASGLPGSASVPSGSAGFAGEFSEDALFSVWPSLAGGPNAHTPLVLRVGFETHVPVAGQLEVSGEGEVWRLELPMGTAFDIPVIGLLPGSYYEVELSLAARGGTWRGPAMPWTTPELPADFPRFEVSENKAAGMEPGMTLFAPRPRSGRRAPLVVVDRLGQVRWYSWNETWPGEDARVLPSGNLLINSRACAVRELDWLGNVVAAFHAADPVRNCPNQPGSLPVLVDSFHHEVDRPAELDGNYLTLSSEVRGIDDFPTSAEDIGAPRGTARVAGSVIVEFSPDGEVQRYIPMMDVVDPRRIGRDSLSNGTLAAYYGKDVRDWDHGNAVVYDPDSNAYLVSQRHQDAIVKVSRESGELVWILGAPENWRAPYARKLLEPVSSLVWPFHQHAIELTPLGLAMYDNGNHRAPAFEPVGQDWSRVVVFDVDEEQGTVSEVWSHGQPTGSGSFFSHIMGDADWQPGTGNFLYVNAAQGEIVEVTSSGAEVFHLRVTSPQSGEPLQIYRAERIADLRVR